MVAYRLAVGGIGRTAASETFRARPDVTQDHHRVEGLPIGTRGGTSVVHTFPADGHYRLKASLHYEPLGGLAFRQGMSFIHKRNEYMVTMAQNLYFHALADNRGVMTVLADRAADQARARVRSR